MNPKDEDHALNDAGFTLKQLSDRAAISDLIHGYALHIRSGKGGECRPLFTEDAYFEVRIAEFATGRLIETQARFEDRSALLNYLVKASTGSRLCPVIQNMLIDLDSDRASATSVMTTLFPPQGRVVGEYLDHFRVESGRWCFSSRVFTIYT